MALKYFKIQDSKIFFSALFFGWKYVQNLGLKIYSEKFSPKQSFVKSIPSLILSSRRRRSRRSVVAPFTTSEM
jgi:hypothetical protein